MIINKIKVLGLLLLASSVYSTTIKAQLREPEFIGEAYILKNDSITISLDKEIADYTSGVSWSANSWNALSLEVGESKANTRFTSDSLLKLLVRASDNNSDPLSIISIYKLKSKGKKRTVVLSEDNSGTLMKSSTNSKDLVRFNCKKFGSSSYLIELNNLKPGEYGIVVSNPNNKDGKRTVISCFGVD